MEELPHALFVGLKARSCPACVTEGVVSAPDMQSEKRQERGKAQWLQLCSFSRTRPDGMACKISQIFVQSTFCCARWPARPTENRQSTKVNTCQVHHPSLQSQRLNSNLKEVL